MAALPALLWLLVKVLNIVLPQAAGAMTLLDMLTSAILVLFVINWFRFSLFAGEGPVAALRAATVKTVRTDSGPLSLASVAADPVRSLSRGGRMLARIVVRITVVVLAVSVILLPPTVVLAAGMLAVMGQLGNQAATGQAVAAAMPLAALLASPLLVRFYIYYAALAAGRPDVGALDVWRWSRGKSLGLLALLALALAPGVLALMLVGTLGEDAGLLANFLMHVMAVPLLFLSLGVMASVTARAIAGLVLPPVMAQQ